MLTGEPPCFYAGEDLAEPLIGFEDAKVVDAVSSSEVQENKREKYLFVRPPSLFHVEMVRNARTDIEHRRKVRIEGKTCKGSHT